MTFNHAVAYGKLAIKNFTGAIDHVDLVFPEPVCGTSCYFYYDEDSNDFGKIKNANINTITLNPDNVEGNIFWFACAPTAGASGKMEVIVTDSNEKTYTKTIDLSDKALPFNQGRVSSFGVDMDGIEADHCAIADGDYAILAIDGDDYYAVSVNANGTSSRRDRVKVNYNGGDSFETSKRDLIWTFTASTDTYKIANDTDYMGAGKNTIPLKTESYAANVTIAENGNGTYTLKADCGSDGIRYMAMNDTNGFGWYAESTGTHNLYLVPASYVTPTLYDITVNDTTNGSVTSSKDNAEAGETITITVTPDPGYQLDALTYNGIDIKESKSFVMPAENVTISASFIQSEGGQGGELKTWTYEVSTTSPTLNEDSPAIVNEATWSIAMGEKVGEPSTQGIPTNSYSNCGWKWGNSKSAYWKSYTLSTDYFAEKKVKSVTVKFMNNGAKDATMVVTQGSTTIGTASANFGTTWTDLTAETTQGTGGTLSIQYSVDQASFIHSITVKYYE